VLKVQQGGESKRTNLTSSRDYAIVGFVIGGMAGFFFTSDWTYALIAGAAGAIFLYIASRKTIELSDLLRKVVGAFLLIYGLFAELAPQRYPIGNVPQNQVSIVALGMILFGLYMLRHELGLV
jgi:hypothetical protein